MHGSGDIKLAYQLNVQDLKGLLRNSPIGRGYVAENKLLYIETGHMETG